MGTALIKLKIMPESPSEDLENIKVESKKIIEEKQGQKTAFEEKPIAFGLKSVIASFSLDEEHDLEEIQKALGEISGIKSVEVEDMRRAFG